MAKSKIKCLWLEPTEFMQLSLRRYRGMKGGESECQASGVNYHNALVVVESMLPKDPEHPNGCGLSEHPDYPRTDPRWPKTCACGYEFKDDDHWQINLHILYGNPEMNGLITIGDAPIGAMWDAWWYNDHYKGQDGKCIVVRTPGGDWIVDGTARDGGRWTRTGTPPNITVKPSIGIGGEKGKWAYHGFLTDGHLVEC
jgi:hypothetical protein